MFVVQSHSVPIFPSGIRGKNAHVAATAAIAHLRLKRAMHGMPVTTLFDLLQANIPWR